MEIERYEAPTTLAAAASLLAETSLETAALAGGTDLLVQAKLARGEPLLVVDVKHIAELRQIAVSADGIELGAAVTGAEMGEHAELVAAWPGVVEAVELIGSTQIQGRATPGGNLCNASPAADSVPALIAAGARCRVFGPGGEREVPVEAIVTGPGRTCLEPGEFVVSFRLAGPNPRRGDAYLRFIPRTEMDIAVAGAGICLEVDAAGAIVRAGVGLGAVAPTPLRVDAAAEALTGGPLDEAALDRLGEAVRAACQPIDDKRGTAEYRTHIAGVLARRAATIAYERARS